MQLLARIGEFECREVVPEIRVGQSMGKTYIMIVASSRGCQEIFTQGSRMSILGSVSE